MKEGGTWSQNTPWVRSWTDLTLRARSWGLSRVDHCNRRRNNRWPKKENVNIGDECSKNSAGVKPTNLRFFQLSLLILSVCNIKKIMYIHETAKANCKNVKNVHFTKKLGSIYP